MRKVLGKQCRIHFARDISELYKQLHDELAEKEIISILSTGTSPGYTIIFTDGEDERRNDEW
jgi:hypothetical protein